MTGALHEYIAPMAGVRFEGHPILTLAPNTESWVWCYFLTSADAQVRGRASG